METKIVRTLKQRVPSIFSDQDEYTEDEALQSLAQYCVEKIALHDRNAIEKEI